MATISGANNEKIFSLKKWGGLNEAPDGDTRLKLGEASKMVNWKITRDGNLKRRPGMEVVAGLCDYYRLDRENDISSITEDITELLNEDGEIQIYESASVMTPPGKVTLTNGGVEIVNGVLKASGLSITDGVLSIRNEDDESIIAIHDGVLSVEGSLPPMKVEELAEFLSGLDAGEYYYIAYHDVVYALNGHSIVTNGNKTLLYGYVLSATGMADGEPVTDLKVQGLWSGLVAGKEVLLAACNGAIWSLYDADTDSIVYTRLTGNFEMDGRVAFFPFDGKVYILTGHEYLVYDGEEIRTVVGYRPVVADAISPKLDDDGNTASGWLTGEYVNKLNGLRRVWISPDGEEGHDTFPLPEGAWIIPEREDPDEQKEQERMPRPAGALISLDWIRNRETNSKAEIQWISGTTSYEIILDGINYTVSLNMSKGWVTFNPQLPKSENVYEIAYTVENTLRDQVIHNRFAEIFSGPTDNMVWIYGDGTNRALYSGMDEDGLPRADYFPDQYEVHVGDGNTPITSMVRHYGDLVCYKTDSTWALTQTVMELATQIQTIQVNCTPVNRDKGNVAPGQVRLVDNNPVTASGHELYHWVNSSYYTSTLSRDERQARRISDRIQSSIKDFDLAEAVMWDDNDNQEFYLCWNGIALIWNYATDTWYRYENFDAVAMCSFHGEVIFGTSKGLVTRLTSSAITDMGEPIHAEWVSGALDFNAANMRKYSSALWVGLKPVDNTSVSVCVQTDRKNTFKDKIVSSEKAKVDGESFMVKTKIKAKKFVFYRLMLEADDYQPAVTVTDIEIRVRQTGYAK